MESRIALIVPWFGQLPKYFELFAQSVSNNPILSYHFWTDRPDSETAKFEKIQNIFFHHISFADYCKIVSETLGIEINYNSAYKLCDLKPFLPYIHSVNTSSLGGGIVDYQFVGYADIDLVFGDMQSYLEPVLDKIDYFSSHADRISGHFFFMINTDKFRHKCFDIVNWKQVLADSRHYGIDEGAFCDVVCRALGITRRIWHRTSSGLDFAGAWRQLNKLCQLARPFVSRRKHFKELHSTHSAISPNILNYEWTDTEWLFKDGKIIGVHNGKSYPYLHFLFLKTVKEIPVSPVWGKDFYRVVDVKKPVLITRTEIKNI